MSLRDLFGSKLAGGSGSLDGSDYREYILNQAQHIQQLQDQMFVMQRVGAEGSAELQDKVSRMAEHSHSLESQLRDANAVVLELQARLAASEGALSSAEYAAASAASQCAHLSTEVASLAVVEAASRKSMATRNCMLKDGLRQSEARVRALADDKRRRAMETTAICRLHDEAIANERVGSAERHKAEMQAVALVEKASAQMTVERVRLELDAYKEPWMYLHGRKAPTANAEVAHMLGLKMTALNTLHVPP
ncbi:hypothetical protein FOA52_014448 [Chlamydomonas sp. UWO 241]|nr:hypothetical protein FOA52_014448 [Chlamydomonas sp. UWO 241]